MEEVNLDLPHVTILILNRNGWKYTIECLESLYQINYPNYDVIVMDNASTDGSIQKIKQYCNGEIKIQSKYVQYDPSNKPIAILECTKYNINKQNFSQNLNFLFNYPSNKKIQLIINEKDYKYGRGVYIALNYIIKNIKTDYIFLLNNDTAVEKGFLIELIKISETSNEIGILSPRICLYDNPNMNQSKKLQNVKNPIEIHDFVSGAAYLFKIDLLKTIGLIDPRFIFFTEEKDFCYRALKAGYKIIYVPTKSRVFHKIGGDTKEITGFRLYHKTRSNLIFKRKHLNNLKFILFLIRFFVVTFLRELSRYPKEKIYFVKGVKDSLFFILKDKPLLLGKVYNDINSRHI
ncbi:MAG: glycosyltransferase family 2 protein [Candidatus Hodarchaeota archaeon]